MSTGMTTMQLRNNRQCVVRSGFTLIELLIVIVILGILALLVVPQISVSTEEAKLSALRSNLANMRRAIAVYYVEHTNVYPATVAPLVSVSGVVTPSQTFVAQMTRYTDQSGNISNSKDKLFRYGPYLKGSALPKNPFNNNNDITVDTTETDITVKSSDSAGTGWKFYSRTGVLMASDGLHDSE